MAQVQPAAQVPNAEPDTMCNLMVNYIPTTIDELQLRQLFEQYGPIETVKIVCDRETRQSRGYGFVKYRQTNSAAMAIQELNGYPILNKRLKVALANHDAHPPRQQQNNRYPTNAGNQYQQQAPNPYAAQMQAQQQMMAMQYQQYLAMQAQQAAAAQQGQRH